MLEDQEMGQVRDEAYVGMHVRRGDNLLHEAKMHKTEVWGIKPYLGGGGGILATTR